jgi:aspartate aminotransferase-like enzyme
LLVAAERFASPGVTAAFAPAGVAVADLRRRLEERYGVVIAGGQGPLKERLFRVGHLGYVDEGMVLHGLAMLEAALRDLGAGVEMGTAVAAAREVWGE